MVDLQQKIKRLWGVCTLRPERMRYQKPLSGSTAYDPSSLPAVSCVGHLFLELKYTLQHQNSSVPDCQSTWEHSTLLDILNPVVHFVFPSATLDLGTGVHQELRTNRSRGW
jgi:hypothetical protein